MYRSKKRPRTRNDLIIEVWNRLGAGAVGASELWEIQRAIRGSFGETAANSPAAIARVLADQGAELRHPEVIEADAQWRELVIKSTADNIDSLENLYSGKPLRLKSAEALISKLENLRSRSASAGDQQTVQRARDIAIQARQVAQSFAGHRASSKQMRAEQSEIAEWLGVWIKTPGLFGDWLDLRRRSPEFRRKFPDEMFTVQKA